MEDKFKAAQENHPTWGDYIVLRSLVKGKGFRRSYIEKWFKKLVPKDDYDPRDRKELIRQLEESSVEKGEKFNGLVKP